MIQFITLSDCRGHDLLIALDSYRTVGPGIEDVQLVVILDHAHEVHTDGVRRKACPSSSEVLADVVRRGACPSSSEVPTSSVRRKGEVPILPPPKSPETSKKATS